MQSPNADMAPVEIRAVSRRFGEIRALSDVSIQIRPNSLTGLIGADGAGKTTLMRICATLDREHQGTVWVLGLSTTTQKRLIRNRIGYMPQRFSLYPDLTVEENIFFFADIFTIPAAARKTRIRRLLSFARLEQFVKRKAGDLSGGMKQKLALCCALIHEPAVLFLDEPTVGVDPLSRREFWNILHELHQSGTTIVLTTPYMDEAEYCEELILLHKGKVLRTGTPSGMMEHYPLSIYRMDTAARVPKDMSLPQGIVHLYTTGGSLRIVAERGLEIRDVQSRIAGVIGGPEEIHPVKAGIEDVFIHELMSGAER